MCLVEWGVCVCSGERERFCVVVCFSSCAFIRWVVFAGRSSRPLCLARWAREKLAHSFSTPCTLSIHGVFACSCSLGCVVFLVSNQPGRGSLSVCKQYVSVTCVCISFLSAWKAFELHFAAGRTSCEATWSEWQDVSLIVTR